MHLGLNLLFLVPGATGGRETYARELLAAMLEAEPGLRVTAYANAAAAPELRRDLGGGVAVRAVPVRIERPERWAAGELALVPAMAGTDRVDVLHSPANFGPFAGPFVRVQTLHDLQYRALPALQPRGRRILTGWMLRAAARRADRLITGSEAAREEIVAAYGVPRARIDVIPHGVRVPNAPVSDAASLARRLGVDGRPMALTVASNLPHKNLAAVIDALALIEPARRPALVMAGLATDDGSLAERARGLGVQDDVRLLGRCDDDELERLYALAACVVLPSLYEGFGLPAIEAMARGVPVAAADIPTLREVTAGAGLAFDPRRPGSLADALTRLLEDGALRERLHAAGLERAAAFTWSAAAHATLDCYRRALASAAARSPSRFRRASS
jgi:glycosyltransferase involved in cell wall biosynthesis